MPPQQQDPYHFIMNADQKPKNSFNLGNSMKVRLIIVGVGLVLLIIVALVINSLLNQGDKAQTQRLIDVAKSQNEIVRVSVIAADKAKNADTQNFAMNTRLSLESSQQNVRQTLSKRGVKGKGLNKALLASVNTKTNTTLEEAERNNRFDETFLALMSQQLTDYQKLLQATYDAGSPSEKKTLRESFDTARLLESQTHKK